MNHIATIGFITFGSIAIAFAMIHEFTWQKRRKWQQAHGSITNFKKEWSDCEIVYYPEISYSTSKEIRKFYSKYGSSKEPKLGVSIDLLISPDGSEAEHFSASNRLLFTIFPFALGIIFIVVGAYIQPMKASSLKPRKTEPNQAPEPMHMLVMPAASHLSRQAYASAHL